MQETQRPKVIVCAAMRQGNIIVAGARHFDSIMLSQIKAMNIPKRDWEQGFIDQYGNFLTREEAWGVADTAGQIKKVISGMKGLLWSENLY